MHRLVIGGFCLLCGATLTSSVTRGSGAFFVVPGLAFLVGGVLAARGAKVEFGPEELVIRRTWGSDRIPRADIVSVGVTRGSNAAGLPWRVPYFRRRKGPMITVEEIRSLRVDTVVDRVVEIGRQWSGALE